jgi:hypothetical protein
VEVATGGEGIDVDAADEAEDEAAVPGASRRGTLSGGSEVSLALDISRSVSDGFAAGNGSGSRSSKSMHGTRTVVECWRAGPQVPQLAVA